MTSKPRVRAARAGYDVRAAVAEVQGGEDPVRHRYLLDRVFCQRDADRIADAVGQELAEGRRGLYGAGQLCAGLRHSQVQGGV